MNIKEYLTNANAIDCGEYYILTCPKCHHREAYMYKDDIGKKKQIPIRCNRLNNCGEKTLLDTANIDIEENLELTEEERRKEYSRERARVVTPDGAKYLSSIMKSGSMLQGFDFDYRGISNKVLKKYNIVYLKEGWIFWLKRRDEKLFGKMYFSPKYENRDILIPLYSINGELDRILLRSKDKQVEPKEIQCRINKNGEEVFNIQALKSSAKNIFVCEGAFDALSIIEATGDNGEITAVGLPGVGKWKKFLEVCKKTEEVKDKNIIFCFDNDDAGKKYQSEAVEAFQKNNLNTFSYEIYSYNDCNDFLVNEKAKFGFALKKFVKTLNKKK